MSALDFCPPLPQFAEWSHPNAEERLPTGVQWAVDKRSKQLLAFFLQSEVAVEESEPAKTETQETTPERFHRLADEWSREVSNVSSLTAMTSHPKYRQIVDMGWEVVPLLLADLEQNRRFWLPALREITGIQPFDPRDAGNSKRMTESWIKWGRNRYRYRDVSY
jgi:hypothetical protein